MGGVPGATGWVGLVTGCGCRLVVADVAPVCRRSRSSCRRSRRSCPGRDRRGSIGFDRHAASARHCGVDAGQSSVVSVSIRPIVLDRFLVGADCPAVGLNFLAPVADFVPLVRDSRPVLVDVATGLLEVVAIVPQIAVARRSGRARRTVLAAGSRRRRRSGHGGFGLGSQARLRMLMMRAGDSPAWAADGWKLA